jgi:hypothetical protein
MKATFTQYRPKEIAEPKGMIKCEICATSGLLATDKCFETAENKETGEKVQRRTTYFEIASPEQAPKNPCDVHGDTQRSFVKVIPGEEWPRAALAVDVTAAKPVLMKAPTVIGEVDPYNSIQAVNNVVAAKSLDGRLAPMSSSNQVPAPADEPDAQIEVRRAEPVRPIDRPPEEETAIKLDPPAPIEF